MKTKLSNGIFWDTDKVSQDAETLAWINENVLSKLGLDGSNQDFLTPEIDSFGRPFFWKYETDDYTIEVVREYIYPNSGKWAKKGDKINVISHD